MRIGVLVLLVASASCSSPPRSPVEETPQTWDGSAASTIRSRVRPTVGTKGMVSAENAEAAEWGAEILRRGGNAVDAAVATAFALAATRPHEASPGGGGFLLYCPAGGGDCTVLDFREEAPADATRDMFVRDGKAQPELSLHSPLASGVPGFVAGLTEASKRFGTKPLGELLSRPIEMAKKGFVFTGWEEDAAISHWKTMNEAARKIFGCGGHACRAGAVVAQKDLAKVFAEIARHGRDGFYRGWVARKIAEGFRQAGGLITEQDLAAYEVKVREPVRTHYRGYEIVTMPPPSNGGVALAQMLAYAELADEAHELGPRYLSLPTLHVLAHAMQLAYADRARLFGDPDQVAVPVASLLDPGYLRNRWKTFDPSRANLSVDAGLSPPPRAGEGAHTTHFSVTDRWGGAVAMTVTVNRNFGSGFVPPGTGVVMNNEMDDFSAQPGVPNSFDLIGGEANAIAPHKRPVSSMAPTIVRDERGRVRLVLGAAGGPTIATSVFLTLFERLRLNISLPDAVAMGRIHQQWRPKTLLIDTSMFSDDLLAGLAGLGYTVEDFGDFIGRIHAIEVFPDAGHVWGVADGRAEGGAVPE